MLTFCSSIDQRAAEDGARLFLGAQGAKAMMHRNYDYGIKSVAHESGPKFQWTIYDKAEVGPNTIGPELYLSHAEAEQACRKAIDDGLALRIMVDNANRP